MTHLKTFTSVALVAAAALSMTACADMDGHHDHFAHADSYAGVYADGYYDDFYGPVDTGYWGDDGAFMYRGADQQFHRDDAGHFRKDAAQGYHTVHTHATRPGNGGHSPDHN